MFFCFRLQNSALHAIVRAHGSYSDLHGLQVKISLKLSRGYLRTSIRKQFFKTIISKKQTCWKYIRQPNATEHHCAEIGRSMLTAGAHTGGRPSIVYLWTRELMRAWLLVGRPLCAWHPFDMLVWYCSRLELLMLCVCVRMGCSRSMRRFLIYHYVSGKRLFEAQALSI